MTIKELENRTGMTRANIRFYEGEGLLTPKRLENGYRDYSEEDARTLEKIKLLRQLQLDIDTIRKVQQGTLTLDQALFVQTTKLEGDKAVIERAAQVCRELQRSSVEYAVLEPQPWLRRLEPPERPGLPEAPPPAAPADQRDDEPRACWHPWQRYFARSLDMALYDTIINVAWLLIFRDQGLIRLQAGGPLASLLFGAALLALTLALEPLWLHFWGWTPGKWVFGLKLRDGDGTKLSLEQAWERSWRVAWEGYGWNIPLWGQWQMWQGRVTGLEGRDCHWDCENDYRYTKVERWFSSGWVFVGARAVCAGLLLLAVLWSALPPCRGGLTVAEFARNYNHAMQVAEYGGQTGNPTLDETGRWVEREKEPGTAIIYLFGDTTRYDQPEFTVEDGRVTAVTLHMESWDNVVGSGYQESLALMALARGEGGVHLFNILSAYGEAEEPLNRWEDLDQDLLGVHISQRVEYTGYEYTYAFGGHVLWAADGSAASGGHGYGSDSQPGQEGAGQGEDVPCHCEKTVTISLIE